MKEAACYEKLADGKVRCHLCPHECEVAEGRSGLCGVRTNRQGTLYSEIYEQVTSIAMDPVEKKPLYHFHPGTHILSLGTRGCNFACQFCQNWSISQSRDVPTSRLPSGAAVQAALRERAVGIAYTYNEPLIWFEYVRETAALAHENGLANVLVTNGYVCPEPFDELLPHIDAINMDLKSIRPDFYTTLCRGRLEPVLRNARTAAARTHLEVTNLVIPGYNDAEDDLEDLARWIAEELGPHVPTHLSAYFPRYRLQAPPTPLAAMEKAYEIFRRHLQHVYLGNARSEVGSSTFCPACGAELVRRRGYATRVNGLKDGQCASCGADAGIVV
ncbi:MAG: AmmeMemoRadiSam system radical SAM enzyme [bacterium]